MLLPDPAVLQEALNRYRALSDTEHRHDDPASRRKLQDAVYTLCVLTGTRTLDSALSVAERMRTPSARRHAGAPAWGDGTGVVS